jgi:hypothetical protein
LHGLDRVRFHLGQAIDELTIAPLRRSLDPLQPRSLGLCPHGGPAGEKGDGQNLQQQGEQGENCNEQAFH